MRNENVQLAQGQKCFGSFALEVANDPLCHILDIERALPQIRVVNFTQSLGVTRGDFLENRFHVAKIGLQLAQHFID